jgi:hypothetical protein
MACLVLARTDGKSLEDYLTLEERTKARAVAIQALTSRAQQFHALWEALPSEA